MSEPWLSVVAGGMAAAVITLVFNVWWDSRKQRLLEDWEFRRYHANMIHQSTAGLMEAYFAGKAEMLYLTSTLEALLAGLNQLSAQVDNIARQQGGPNLTMAEFDQRKQQLMQPFYTYNNQQVALRWNQYEQKAKENHAKAELHLTTLKPLIAVTIYEELVALFLRLSTPFTWDLPNGKEKLKTLEDALPEVLTLRQKLMHELERQLGRTTNPEDLLGQGGVFAAVAL